MIAALAARQHGVVSLAQLLDAGLDKHAIRRRVLSGRLHHLHRGVYAVGHAGLSFEGRCMAAVLACGDNAALSHLAAAELQRISRWPVAAISVVTTTRHKPRGVDVHHIKRLDPRDVTRVRGIPVTTVPRVLIDMTDSRTEHQLAWMIHEAVYWRRFDVAATRRAMRRANGRRYLKRLERAIELHLSGSAGTRSGAEDAFLERLPEEQRDTALVNTKIEVDVLWPDRGLAVEVDGPGHARPAARREDAARDERLRQAGIEVTRVRSRRRPGG